jgi:hypothetical protein
MKKIMMNAQILPMNIYDLYEKKPALWIAPLSEIIIHAVAGSASPKKIEVVTPTKATTQNESFSPV